MVAAGQLVTANLFPWICQKFENSKDSPILWRENFICKLCRVFYLDTLGIENVTEIALCHTVIIQEIIQAFLCFLYLICINSFWNFLYCTQKKMFLNKIMTSVLTRKHKNNLMISNFGFPQKIYYTKSLLVNICNG